VIAAVRKDGVVAAVESRQLYRAAREGGAWYRAQLAANLRELGLPIERRTGQGERYFAIPGVPAELAQRWSTRSRDVERAARVFRTRYGREPRAGELDSLALGTRGAKSSADPVEVSDAWRAVGPERGLTSRGGAGVAAAGQHRDRHRDRGSHRTTPEGGREARPWLTTDGLIKGIEKGHITLGPQTVVVMDEAGMADTRRKARLIELTAQSQSKLLLVGDAAQLSSIGPGGLFKELEGKVPTAELREVHRANHEWERRAWEQIRAGEPGPQSDPSPARRSKPASNVRSAPPARLPHYPAKRDGSRRIIWPKRWTTQGCVPAYARSVSNASASQQPQRTCALDEDQQ